MFNFKEIRVIHDALQNSPMVEGRTEVIKKLFDMVNSLTFQSIAPCVRPRDVDGVQIEPRERMKVFETERELHGDIERILKDAHGKHQMIQVLVSVPNENLAEKIGMYYRNKGGRLDLGWRSHHDYRFGQDCRITVVDRHHDTCGMSIDWAFFYNEVAGF